jgi:membrane protease subunit HflK
LTEYQLAPEITRKRLYLETMETVMARNRKVFLDVDSSGNILYLPLDQAGSGANPSGILPPIKTPIGTDSRNSAPNPRNKNREGRQ